MPRYKYEVSLGKCLVAVFLVVLTACHTSRKNTEDELYQSTVRVDAKSGLRKFGIELQRGDNHKLYAEVEAWLGVPYCYGGTTRSGVDCSGLVGQLYDAVYGVPLQRNSAKILQINCQEIKKAALKEGDLVFFSSQKSRAKINHVGLYLKDQKFVHAGSKGVVIDSLGTNYYKSHYVASGRVKR